jgi:hypothetical protein
MATAQRPGASRRKTERTQAQSSLATITIRGETHKLAIGTIPLREKSAVRRQTGLPFETFWTDSDHIGEDSIAVMWWLARRANGEPNLSYSEVEEQWPSDLTEEDIQFEVETPDGEDDHPEASGPGSSTPGPSSPPASD